MNHQATKLPNNKTGAPAKRTRFWRVYILATVLSVAAIAGAFAAAGFIKRFMAEDEIESAHARARAGRLMLYFKSSLDSHWSHFQKDVQRTFREFCQLAVLSAIVPDELGNIRTTYIRLATRDLAFAPKVAPYKTEGNRAWYKDADFLGDVETVDEIPVVLGARFKATGLLKKIIPAIEGEKLCETIDTRFETAAMVKRRLADYKSRNGSWRLWCVGLKDFIVTPGGARTADFYLDAFLDDSLADLAAQISITSPADLFASYIGTSEELEPALAAVDESAEDPLGVYKLPFPEGAGLLLRASDVTPEEPVAPAWLLPGSVEDDLFAGFTNRIDIVRRARTTALKGFLEADAGNPKAAVELWAEAARANPGDALLMNLGDLLDLDARRYLAIGNVNGALNCYENRSEIFPDDVATIHNFGVCLKKAGKSDIAVKAFMRALAMDPQNESHRMELVEAAEAAGRIDLAARQADILAAHHPNDPAIKLLAAKLWCRSANPARDNTKALALANGALRAARALGADERTYKVGLADVLIECGEVEQGMKIKMELRNQ